MCTPFTLVWRCFKNQLHVVLTVPTRLLMDAFRGDEFCLEEKRLQDRSWEFYARHLLTTRLLKMSMESMTCNTIESVARNSSVLEGRKIWHPAALSKEILPFSISLSAHRSGDNPMSIAFPHLHRQLSYQVRPDVESLDYFAKSIHKKAEKQRPRAPALEAWREPGKRRKFRANMHWIHEAGRHKVGKHWHRILPCYTYNNLQNIWWPRGPRFIGTDTGRVLGDLRQPSCWRKDQGKTPWVERVANHRGCLVSGENVWWNFALVFVRMKFLQI